MANEATVRSSLTIRVGEVDYSSRPSAFVADVTGSAGPSPGLVPVSVSGTDVNFASLFRPGFCRVQNQDSTNYVTLGVYDPDTDVFYPLLELLPGESYVVRLSRFLLRESTGTGTQPGGYNSRLHLRANTATCNVLVEAFEV